MSKKKETSSKASTQEETKIPIKWHIPDTITTRFASNMVFQNVEGLFKISFFELKPEIYLKTSSTLPAPPTEITAECVCSIVMHPDKLPAIINVLNKQWQQYQETMKDKSEPHTPSNTD